MRSSGEAELKASRMTDAQTVAAWTLPIRIAGIRIINLFPLPLQRRGFARGC